MFASRRVEKGEALQCQARQGKVLPDKAGQGVARHGRARQKNKALQDQATQGKAL